MKTHRSFFHSWLPFLALFVIGAAGALALQSFALLPVVYAAPSALEGAPVPESWTAGVTLEGSPQYSNLAGRLLTGAASFRSNASVQDIYYVFPAASDAKTVLSARYLLLQSSGSYPGTTRLTLEVFGYDGTLEHTVSAVEVDLTTVPQSTWQEMALSAAPGDLVIPPGSFLAYHFSLSGAPGGSLDLRPIFDVLVQ